SPTRSATRWDCGPSGWEADRDGFIGSSASASTDPATPRQPRRRSWSRPRGPRTSPRRSLSGAPGVRGRDLGGLGFVGPGAQQRLARAPRLGRGEVAPQSRAPLAIDRLAAVAHARDQPAFRGEEVGAAPVAEDDDGAAALVAQEGLAARLAD